VSRSTDEHIAEAMAAVRDESRRWSAMAQAQQAASRAADRRVSLLVMALSTVLVLGTVAASAATARLALSGTLLAVPVFVALLGLSASLALYVIGAALALSARERASVAVTMTGRTLTMATALATVLAGVLVAVNGLPSAAALAGVAAIGVAVLGRKLASIIQPAAA
jgi:hypothetical protein